MLVGIFCVIAALSAAGICVWTDAFTGLSWLWVLPVSFVGAFLVLWVLWVVLLLILCACVKMDEPQDKDDPFYRCVVNLTIKAVVTLLPVHVHTQGLEMVPKTGRFLLVSNHIHDIDPGLLMWALPGKQLAFISKQENEKKPVIGPLMHKIGCQPINRENDREALKTILKCVQMVKADEVSIGVFPEGYTSLDRKLHPFRSGVFKIAQRAQIPIVVCTLQNTWQVLSNAKKLKRTDVLLHVLGVIPPEELKGVTAVQIGERVHAMMARDLGPEMVLEMNESKNTGDNT